MIKFGDHLPAGMLVEFVEVETEGCSIGPNPVDVLAQVTGKKIVIFGVPGAYTPTCSAKHVPDFIAAHDALHARGVDEVWCLSVNDPFVMGAWGRDQKATGKVRMIADGSADYTRKLGLEQDLSKRGLGVRAQRFSMLVEDGVVRTLDIDPAGTFDKTDARTMLNHLD